MRTPRIVAGTTAVVLAIGLLVASPVAAAPAEHVPVRDDSRTTSTGAVQLAWNVVDGAAGYKVQVSTQASTSSILEQADTRSLSWTPTTLFGAIYDQVFWRVAAYGTSVTAADLGDYSEWHALPLTAPAKVTLLAPAAGAIVDYPAAPVFSWSAVDGADSYTLTYSTDPNFAVGSATTTVTVAGTTYSPSTRLAHSGAGTRWYWRVGPRFAPASTPRAEDIVSSSFLYQWSPATSQPVLQSASSVFPNNSGLDDALGADEAVTSARFTWSTVPGAARYKIVLGRKASSPTTVTEIFHTAVTSNTTYVPTVTLPDVGLHWQVTALDANDNSGTPSKVSSFTKAWGAQVEERNPSTKVVIPSPTFGGESLATAQDVTIGDVELTWEPVPGATFYSVTASATDGSSTLSCRTPSNSATIIGWVNQGKKDQDTTAQQASRLTDASRCLWDSTAAKRISVGKTYRWTVKAFDYSAALDAKYQGEILTSGVAESAESPARYFKVVPDTTESTATATRVGLHNDLPTTSYEPAPRLSWDAVAGAGYYEVEVALNSQFTQRVGWFYTPSRRMQLNGIFANEDTPQPYYVRVRAGSETNWSSSIVEMGDSESDYATWNQDSVDITFPTNAVTASADDPGTFLLRWDAIRPTQTESGGHRGYLVTITNGTTSYSAKTTPSFVTAQAFTTRPVTDNSTTTEKRLAPGTYTWSVAPLDAAGKVGRATPGPAPFTVTSSAPSGLTAQPMAGVSGLTTALTWNAPHGATRYTVTVTDPAGVKTVYPRSGTLLQPALVVPTALSGTYTWTVTAYDIDDNESSPSAESLFRADHRAPVPTTAEEADFTARTLGLTWNPVTGASGYRVRLSTSSATVATSTATVVRGTSYVPTGALVYGQRYFWSVEAFGPSVSGSAPALPQSEVRAFTVSTRPGTPTGLRVIGEGRSITASWTPLSGAQRGSLAEPSYILRYRIARTDGASNPWIERPPVSALVSQQLTGLPLATTYEFQIAARNAQGASPWSDIRATSTADVPGAVTSLSATATLHGATVTWRSPSSNGGSPVTGYLVEYRTSGGVWTSQTATATSLRLTGLAGARSHEIRVSALNAVGAGNAAATTVTTLDLPGAAGSVKATRGDGRTTVTWTAPASTGGQPIAGYAVEMRTLTGKTWSSWTRKVSTTGARSASISGLKNGTTYQVRVVTQTKLGMSAPSSAAQVVPAGKPLAPTSVMAKSTKRKTVKVTWKAADANGSKVTKYVIQYSTNGKSWKTLKTTASKSFTWKKAKSKKAYQFRVYAKNALGSGVKSSTARVTVK